MILKTLSLETIQPTFSSSRLSAFTELLGSESHTLVIYKAPKKWVSFK